MLLPGAIGVGAIVPVQTAINTRLRADVRDPVVTALYSFLIGTTSLLPVAWLLTGQPLPDFALLADSPLWLFFGGPLGVAFIVGNILLFPQIGSVHTVIMPIVGQMLMGLLVDHFGLFGYEVLPISPLRLFGALIVLVATAVVLDIGRGRLWEGNAQGVAAWAWRGFGIAIGVGSATQTAVNGRLGRLSGHQFTPVCCHLRLVLRCCSFSALCCLAVLVFSARSR
ncbi:DMT family transporter [Corynebacterium pseudodiphtheriticum]|uniref:DMT family transporter n=1 Tax=Corynebacterium pseudodiphtheriticum TaxID=37637 RepID=UPI002542FF93|nr:DMT family transporter [Corynebacterium pseudodiphtheriticum]MDK4327353.1 DMT family transporter [Corynebacterium pseudodiphtheriticum]